MPVAEAAVILTPVLDWLDLVGVAVFALSGALIAARERQTFVTMGFFALVTGVGGGTVRDLLIDAPVFWVRHPWYAAVCIAMAAIVWNTPTRWWQGKLFDYADGVGLAAYSVLGAAKAMSYGLPPVSATIMGMEVLTPCPPSGLGDMIWMMLSAVILINPFNSFQSAAAPVSAIGIPVALNPDSRLIPSIMPPPDRAEAFRKERRL